MNPIEKVGAELIKLGGWVKHNFFKKSDYITTSRGSVDAGLPVLTNASGVLDSTLTGGGGGTSDHALLTHLDYASAAHTGFAGTGAANTFTRQQTVQASIDDAPLFTELLTNGGFDTNLSGWTDDSSGWSWSSGAATHDTGSGGVLTQTMANIEDVHVIEMVVSGITTGWAEAYSSGFDLDAYADSGTGTTIKGIGSIAANETITIEVGDGFDGRIESVSVKQVLSGGFPATITLNDFYGNYVGVIKARDGRVIYGDETNPGAQFIKFSAASINMADLPTSSAGLNPGDLWNDTGTLKVA